jgi:hypothetical protein
MALFRMDRAYAWTPEMMGIDGSVTIPTGLTLTTTNLQINPALLNTTSGTGLPNPGTSNLLSTETVAPLGCRGVVLLNPDSASAGAASNTTTLPKAMATPVTTTAGSELLLDLSAYDADIIAASASMRAQNTRGVQARTAYVSAVDNINKLVYIQVVNLADNTAASVVAGDVISFNLSMKDTFSA